MRRNLTDDNGDLFGVPAMYRHRQLPALLFAIFDLMKDGRWYTVDDVAAHVGASVTSTGASIRDLRKPKFGGHTVRCETIGNRTVYSLEILPF